MAETVGSISEANIIESSGRAVPIETHRERKLTVEHALYVAVFAIGVAIRFWGLARVPLNALEALNSWPAWQDASALFVGPDLVPTSPLFFHAQRLIFWLGANGDAPARVVSAAAGSLLVLVPWFFRGLLGRSTALALSLLFAMDPWLIFFSRYADGAMLSTLLAMTILALLVTLTMSGAGSPTKSNEGESGGLSDDRRRTLTTSTAVLFGLYLASGHMAWSFLPILIAFVLMNYRVLRNEMYVDVATAVWFSASLLIGATGWLTKPTSLGMVSGSLTMWVNSILSTGIPSLVAYENGSYPLIWPLGMLVTDQPLVVIFGLGGLAHMTWRRNNPAYTALHWRLVLWIWLVWGLALCLLPGRSPFSLLVIVIPLLFGTAYSVGKLFKAAPVGTKWRESIAVIGTLLLLFVSALIWGAALVSSPSLDMLMLQALLLILLLSAAILVFFGIWSGWKEAFWAGISALGIALLVGNVGASWRVNHWYDLGYQVGLFEDSSVTDVRRLVDDIETLSAQRVGDAHEIPVVIEKIATTGNDEGGSGISVGMSEDTTLVLGWHLRNMRQVEWGTGSDSESLDTKLLISSGNMQPTDALFAGEDYVGSRYDVRTRREPDGGDLMREDSQDSDASSGMRDLLERTWSEELQPWLRWSFYGKGDQPAITDEVILWAPRQE